MDLKLKVIIIMVLMVMVMVMAMFMYFLFMELMEVPNDHQVSRYNPQLVVIKSLRTTVQIMAPTEMKMTTKT